MTRTPDTSIRAFDPWTVFAGWLLVAFAAMLVARNLWVDNAVVFHDEYLYKVWSDVTLSPADILGRDLAPPIPNRLYTWVYGLTAHAGANAYDLAQLLNVGFWGLGSLFVAALAAREGVSGPRFLVLVLAVASLPFSSFTKYFMPEVMYASLFIGAACLLLEGARKEDTRWVVAAGVVTGAMYYVKPHALFAIGIDAVFLLTLRQRWRALAGLVGGFAVAFAVVRGCLPPVVRDAGGLGIYDSILHALSERMVAYGGQVSRLALDLVHVGVAHVAMFLMYASVPFVAACGIVIPRLGWFEGDGRHALFARYLLLATLAMMGVAIAFTVFAGEIGRIHSRYYMFLMPLWLVQLVLARHGRFTRRGAICVSVLVVASAFWLMRFGAAYSPILNLSFVSDGPEWGFIFAPRSRVMIVMAAIVLASVGMVWLHRGSRVLLMAITAMSLIACAMTTIQQKGVFRNSFVDGRDAVTIRQWLGVEGTSHALVVAPDRIVLDKFLFFLDTAPFVALLPEGGRVADIPGTRPGVTALVLLSGTYAEPQGASCRVVGPVIRVCSLAGAQNQE